MTIDDEATALRAAQSHAERAYPREACGLFGGPAVAAWNRQPLQLLAYVPIGNVAITPGSRFAMDPVELALAEHRLRRRGLVLCGIFHSHPDGDAEPSEADCREAWPNLAQVICAVSSGRAGMPRAWRILGTHARQELRVARIPER